MTGRTVVPGGLALVTSRFGLDVKYGVTPSLTLDVAVNPDFAQAEADEQQVNLTQFSVYYPEKREYFLENVTVSTADGAPQRVNGRMAASKAPGLGITPKMGVLGDPVVELSRGVPGV